MKYPTRGKKLTTRQWRTDAQSWDTAVDAQAAIMEHAASNPNDHYSVREYRGEGYFVLIQFPHGGSRWLTY